MRTAALLALLLVQGPPIALDDPASSFCVATGFCRPTYAPPGPASGILFVAVGLVALGVTGWRRQKR